MLESLAPKSLRDWLIIDRICQKYMTGNLAPIIRRHLLLQYRDNERTSRIHNRSAPHSNRSAFSYDPHIDYAKQNTVTIGAISKICPKCFAKNWSNEPNGMCCAASKVIHTDI